MRNRTDDSLPTTDDDRREIATEGGKDAQHLRMPRDEALPNPAVSTAKRHRTQPSPLPDPDFRDITKPEAGDGGEDALSGQPREKGGERPR